MFYRRIGNLFAWTAQVPESNSPSAPFNLCVTEGITFTARLDETRHPADKSHARTVMNRSQKHSTGLRLTVVMVMFIWLLGQTFCLQHCAKLAFTKGAHACCAKKTSDQTKSSSGEGKMLCGSLKLAKLETKTSLPEFATLPPSSITPVALFVLTEITVDLGLPISFRTRPRVDWVFLPEVSLGAALRSLAPPALD